MEPERLQSFARFRVDPRADPPRELVAQLAGRSFEAVTLGESGAGVWRCTAEHTAPLYLKAAPIAAELYLEGAFFTLLDEFF